MRARWLPVVAVLGFAAAVVPALASNQSVTVGPGGALSYSPATVTVDPGESVTWTNSSSGGTHNVVFDDPSVKPFSGSNSNGPPLSGAWSATGTFPNPGSFPYHCGLHGTSMAGTVVVTGSGGGTTTGTTGTTTTPTTPTPTADKTPPSLANVAPTARSFCARARRGCRIAGVSVELTVSEVADIAGKLRKRPIRGRRGRFKDFGTVRFTARIAGDNRFRFTKTAEGKRLQSGSYRLTLAATDASSNRSKARTVSFTVR